MIDLGLPRINGISRDASATAAGVHGVICVYFARDLTDEELRMFHDLLRLLINTPRETRQ